VILLIDNYDSFTYNLAHMFGELGAEVVVRRNDEIDADEADRLRPSFVANLNGDQFVSDPLTRLNDGDSVLILSADAGG